MSKRSIIFDCETVGDIKNPIEWKIYELAWAIFDETGILSTKSYLVKELIESKEIKKAFYYERNKTEINNYAIENIKPWKEVRNLFLADYLKCEEAYAFNINFDIEAMSRTNENLVQKGRKLVLNKNYETYLDGKTLKDNNVKVYDISHLAILSEFQTINNGGMLVKNLLAVDKYSAFCEKYNFKSEKNNNQTTAEAIYNWLYFNKIGKDITIQPEHHIALEDVLMEYEILQFLKTKYDYIVMNTIKERSITRNLDKNGRFNNLWRNAN